MAINTRPTQIDRLDGLRLELEGKIEKKVSSLTFWTVIGGIATLTVSAFFYIANRLDKNDDKYVPLDRRMTVIETQIEERKNKELLALPKSK